MARPEPIIIEAHALREGSPRYRVQPLPLRRAVMQLEKLTTTFGDEVVQRVRDMLDVQAAESVEAYRQQVTAWTQSDETTRGIMPSPPKFVIDFVSVVSAVVQGLTGSLTGSLLVSTQTAHFMDSEVEVEVSGEWVRLVQVGPGKSSELDCSGFDYHLPPEDLFPLWWWLLEANIVPLFRAAWRAAQKAMGGMTGRPVDVSLKPSSEPAVTDSPAS